MPRTGPEALTGSERRIAGPAAEGSTNAETAAAPHLARRTELPAALPPAPYGPAARAG
ncbi:hypothetical protein [Streptomyces werraensis]|uniref:hypothetical protein n=1 Tax=Streptomyces werraensis TaxID=68284 RepID=UPI003676C8FD